LYTYSFDKKQVGDWRLSRAKYQQVHECYKLLLKRIQEWNEIAIAHGAQAAPYRDEVEDLQQMINWGEKRLRERKHEEVVVKGISIGSLRYMKAALIYGASVREADARSSERPDWPAAVLAAMQNVSRPLTELADEITYNPAEILSEVAPSGSAVVAVSTPEWDVFISHASEDKSGFVEPLARELRTRGLNIWYDDFTLTVGDSLRRSIDRGLAHSKFGVVVLSPKFFTKEWPQIELDGLVAREVDGRKVILPVWHEIDAKGIRSYSPTLADRVAVSSSRGVAAVADAIHSGMGIAVRVVTDQSPNAASPSIGHLASVATPVTTEPNEKVIKVEGHIEAWAKRSFERFEILRKKRINKKKADPFKKGYWQASVALQGHLADVNLAEFLEILRKSKTGRTGWDIGWVPTREEIEPYPFQDGIEVWLAEDGGKGPAHSDFWRAERIGTFSLFRGYQEDEVDFSNQFPGLQLDYSLVLWRIAEFLLYIENFSKNLGLGPTSANLRVRWTGLENRQLGYHKAILPPLDKRICRQPSVESQLNLPNATVIKKSLIQDIREITRPLFELFNFFSLTDEEIKLLIKDLFDADKEIGI